VKELPEEIQQLDREILEFISRGMDDPDEEGFNHLARRCFEIQYTHIELYQRYCRRREAFPGEVSSWLHIPALPTDAFKAADLALFPSCAVSTFMTSGTSQPEERGKVTYDEGGLALMDATIREAASAFLFPDGIKALILILAPPPGLAPHMVMAHGMNRLKEGFGLPGSRFLVGETGLQVQSLVDELQRSQKEGIPTAIFGGSFGFVNFFDYCRDKGLRFQLPPGSRCLDAGGFKGKSREVGREEFFHSCEAVLGIPPEYAVNLLGMTETASQFYDNTLRNYHMGRHGPTAKVNPPWTRTLVVDPDTLEPLPDGEAGLLRHFDLANRGHIGAIQTDDMGKRVAGGFEVLGRAVGGGQRGCSLTIDEMTRIAEGR
jgi:hypothetical protein